MFSTSMIASPTIAATAITSPATTIMFRPAPLRLSTSKPVTSDRGIATALIKATRQFQ